LSSPIERRQSLHLQMQESEKRIQCLEEQIAAAQKLAALGTTTAKIAHEINNIFMLMTNYAQQALARQDDVPFMRKALEKTIQHCNQAAFMIESMSGLVNQQAASRETVKLADIVQDCFQSLTCDLRKEHIEVEIQIPEDLTLHAVPSQIQQVLLNLILNARQAMLESGGNMILQARPTENQQLQIYVSDSGCGIEPELQDKIFEPFVTTKTNANSSDPCRRGLGLSVCKDIIQSYNGTITFESTPGEGTTFSIILPLS
jgi:two-component system, NtrC family, sensor kinase